MNSDTWQRLLRLESSDSISACHEKVFGRSLSAGRIAEITSSAKQAREFFRNASTASDSVRALLTFYGVSSLSKAVLLLFKPGTGEASLVPGHGLTPVGWRSAMGGPIPSALQALPDLEIQHTAGLFEDFLNQTENTICMHVHSSAVDWRIAYDVPNMGQNVRLIELIARLPDVAKYLLEPHSTRALRVRDVVASENSGVVVTLDEEPTAEAVEAFQQLGYEVTKPKTFTELRATEAVFSSRTPQFSHTYISKRFGSIPSLYVSLPFSGLRNYSQLGMTYMLSYFLGMLTRYYPTQWVALASGTRGDSYWPAINAAQRYAETCFPELIVEYMENRVGGVSWL